MAETVRLTRIENMPDKRRLFVESLLRQRPRPSGEKVAALYNKEFPPEVTGEDDLDASTVYSHLKVRMQAVMDDIRNRKVEEAAIAELIGERGLDDAAKAIQWETIQSMTPSQLILLRTLELKHKELAVKEKDQAQRIKEFELKEKQWGQREGAVAAVVADEKADPAEVRKRIQEIFGM